MPKALDAEVLQATGGVVTPAPSEMSTAFSAGADKYPAGTSHNPRVRREREGERPMDGQTDTSSSLSDFERKTKHEDRRFLVYT